MDDDSGDNEEDEGEEDWLRQWAGHCKLQRPVTYWHETDVL